MSETEILKDRVIPLNAKGDSFFIKLKDGAMRVMGEMDGEQRYYILEKYVCTAKTEEDRLMVLQRVYNLVAAQEPKSKEAVRKGCTGIPLDFDTPPGAAAHRTLDR